LTASLVRHDALSSGVFV